MCSNEMQKTHKTNIISVWGAAVILSLLSYRNAGMTGEFFMSVGVMFGASLLAVVLYFIPMPDTAKGTAIVSLIGLATLLLSILQGGSDRNFIASFFVLSLATLYFNSKIILGYGLIYMSACVAAIVINPAYIDGRDYEMARVLIKVVIYFCVAAVLFLATRKGERMVAQSQESSQVIRDNASRVSTISAKLHSSIVSSNEGAAKLSQGIGELKDETGRAREDMKDALDHTIKMQDILHTSDIRMEQTAQYSRELSESFGEVAEKVDEGMSIVQSTSDIMETAGRKVSAAHTTTRELLEKMERIKSILKKIDAVAQQTNILSVNAAIEAARSGEYGKGFSVVANEVHDLAIESSDASKDISSIVEDLISTTNAVANQVEEGDKSTRLSVEEMRQLQQCFLLLQCSTKEAGKIVEDEDTVMQEFMSDYGEMRDGLERIAAITKRNVETTNAIDDNILQQNQAVGIIASQMQKISEVSGQLNK